MAVRHPWITVYPDGDAPPEVQALYDEVRDPRGHVDNILSIHSLYPQSLRTHYTLYREAMVGSRDLSRAQREMIAVVVSVANACVY